MKALLFDFFGTLVEYQPDRAELGSPETHELACELGYTDDHDAFVRQWDEASLALEREARRTCREFSMTDAAAAFGAAVGMKLTRDQQATLGSNFVAEWAHHVTPIPGVADLLRDLAAEWTIAVVSNTHDTRMVPDMLAAMAVANLIDVVVLSVDHGWCKPHPSIYATALEQLGCAPGDAVFVGDSLEADYTGPIDAGMRANLIDPSRRADIPDAHRLDSVLDLTERLR